MATTEAPGGLESIRKFLNTVDFESDQDPLAPGDTLPMWCATTEFCTHITHIDEEGLARLRAFREALRNVLLANAGQCDLRQAWAGLKPFTGRASYKMGIAQDGRPALEPQGQGDTAAIAALLAVVYDAVGAGTWARMKACRKHSCRWAFYDRSKNGSGTWCNMAVCGNRVKAERRRARQKTR